MYDVTLMKDKGIDKLICLLYNANSVSEHRLRREESMPKDKTATHEKILPAAKEEFLQKGFEQASMRNIAAKAEMSAAGIYRHFADKEALFAALVQPALDACERWYNAHKEWDYELLDRNDLETMWKSESDAELITEVVYPNYDAFKLLVCRAEGTKYAGFLHDLVMLEQTETLAFMDVARERGIPVKEVRTEELHLLLSAYITALFEVVVHDFPIEDALHYLDTFQQFFYPGWRAVLGM